MTIEEYKSLNSETEVCVCNGVTLNEIVEAIKNGENSIELLEEATDAGSACGLCKCVQEDDAQEREIHLDEIIEFESNG